MADVLFVCVHNAGRSRMAEGLFNDASRRDHGGRWVAASAGTQPAPRPHPEVVQAMAELGIAIDDHPGELLTPEMAEGARLLFSMGCNVEEACPALTIPMEDWALEDPKDQPMEKVRAIRDDIASRVARLLQQLTDEAQR